MILLLLQIPQEASTISYYYPKHRYNLGRAQVGLAGPRLSTCIFLSSRPWMKTLAASISINKVPATTAVIPSSLRVVCNIYAPTRADNPAKPGELLRDSGYIIGPISLSDTAFQSPDVVTEWCRNGNSNRLLHTIARSLFVTRLCDGNTLAFRHLLMGKLDQGAWAFWHLIRFNWF